MLQSRSGLLDYTYFCKLVLMYLGTPDRSNFNNCHTCLQIALTVLDKVRQSLCEGTLKLANLEMILQNEEKFLEVVKTHCKPLEETDVTMEIVLYWRRVEFDALIHMDESVRVFLRLTAGLYTGK